MGAHHERRGVHDRIGPGEGLVVVTGLHQVPGEQHEPVRRALVLRGLLEVGGLLIAVLVAHDGADGVARAEQLLHDLEEPVAVLILSPQEVAAAG